MPLTIEGARARLDGHCSVEEALALSEFLREARDPEVDLAACLSLHTALFQCLLALRPRLVGRPADPVLARLTDAIAPAGSVAA